MLTNGGQLGRAGATKARRSAISSVTINRRAWISRKGLPKALAFAFCMLLTVAFDLRSGDR